MRPSQYNYLKRMWTRNLARKKQQKIRLKKRKRKERRERLNAWYQDFIRAQNAYEIQHKYTKKEPNTKVKKSRPYYKYIFILWTLYVLYSFSDMCGQIGRVPSIAIYIFGVLFFCYPAYLYYTIKKNNSTTKTHHNLNEVIEDSMGMNSPQEKGMSAYEIERYAVMCNAHLEHEDEMEHYTQQ